MFLVREKVEILVPLESQFDDRVRLSVQTSGGAISKVRPEDRTHLIQGLLCC